jgi:hypothetical protein
MSLLSRDLSVIPRPPHTKGNRSFVCDGRNDEWKIISALQHNGLRGPVQHCLPFCRRRCTNLPRVIMVSVIALLEPRSS